MGRFAQWLKNVTRCVTLDFSDLEPVKPAAKVVKLVARRQGKAAAKKVNRRTRKN